MVMGRNRGQALVVHRHAKENVVSRTKLKLVLETFKEIVLLQDISIV